MHVYFKVDGNQHIGTGHFIRCRILARALRREGVAVGFVTATPQCVIAIELADEGFSIHPLDHDAVANPDPIIQLVRYQKDVLVVVDDNRPYLSKRRFFQRLSGHGVRTMVISYRPDVYCDVDMILNQNLLALNYHYSVSPRTRLLLGPLYAVLEDSFRLLRTESPRRREPVRAILVTFGGADRTNQTSKAISALLLLDQVPERVVIVAGGLYKDIEGLRSLLKSHSELNAELHINTSRMAELMNEADLAISSGGLSAWELACLGVPNAIVSTAEPEKQTGLLLGDRGYAHYCGHKDEVTSRCLAKDIRTLVDDTAWRAQLSARSHRLVDGEGSYRVVQAIKSLFEPRKVHTAR